MDADPLNSLPFDLLLALRDAVADPTDLGRQRAEQRAAEAGFYLQCLNPTPAESATPPRVVAEPIAMDPAPEEIDDAVRLTFAKQHMNDGC